MQTYVASSGSAESQLSRPSRLLANVDGRDLLSAEGPRRLRRTQQQR